MGTSFTGAQPPPRWTSTTAGPSRRRTASWSRWSPRPPRTARALTGEDQRAMWLHRDQDLLDGFPRKIIGHPGRDRGRRVLARPRRPRRRQPQRADRRRQRRLRPRLPPRRLRAPRWPVRGDQPALHTGGRAFTGGEVDDGPRRRDPRSVAVDDVDGDGIPEVFAADLEGKVYGWRAGGTASSTSESNVGFSGKPLTPFRTPAAARPTAPSTASSARRCSPTSTATGQQEIVAAAWTATSTPGTPTGARSPAIPLLVVDPPKVASIDPTTHGHFEGDSGAEQNGAIIDTPAVGDLDATRRHGDELPRSSSAPTRSTRRRAGRRPQRRPGQRRRLRSLETAAGCSSPGTRRLYAIKATGDGDADPTRPAPSGRLARQDRAALTELLPIVGEGVTGSPVIGAGTARRRRRAEGRARSRAPASPTSSTRRRAPATARTTARTASSRPTSGRRPGKYDTPSSPRSATRRSGTSAARARRFLAPAAGAIRALDLAVNEYQGGQDFVGAWNSTTRPAAARLPRRGQRPPVPDRAVGLRHRRACPARRSWRGPPASTWSPSAPPGPRSPGWPKLTGDWTVANPVIGRSEPSTPRGATARP